MVPVLVPFLVSDRQYSYVQVAGFVLAATLLSSIVQPAFGLLTDRFALPALVGAHDSYVLALVAVAISGLGVAAFHPEAARLARSVTGGSHVGMSWFSLGGNVGFALAPLALMVAAPARSVSPHATACLAASDVFWASSTSRTATFAAPILATGAVGTVLGGRLATRFGRVRTMRVAYAVAVAAVVGIVLVPGPALLAFIAVAAVALYVPFSLHITLGQDYLPNRIGTASGVTIGASLLTYRLREPAPLETARE
jgi:FSR family fosmidomycin resistance protein-like MFS transporter